MAALLACLLSLLALAATSAQAATSEWMTEGETFEALGIKEETIAVKGGPLTLSVSKLKLTIECTGVEGSGKLFKGGSDEETVTLSSCKVTGLSCEVSGSIVMKMKAEELTEGPYEKVESPEGSKGTIATIKFKEGTGCPIALTQKLTGTVAGEAQTLEKEEDNDDERHLAFSAAITSKVNEKLKLEEKPELSLLLGEFQVTLSAPITYTMSGARANNMIFNVRPVQLCEAKKLTCGGTQTYKVTQAITIKSTVSNVFKFGTTTVTCSEMKLEGEISAASTYVVEGKPKAVAFNGCTTGCKVEKAGAAGSWTFRFLNTQANQEDGWFGIHEPSVTIECVAPAPAVNCHFAIGILTYAPFDAYGGTPAMINSEKHHLIKTAGTCADGSWESSGAGGLLKNEITTPAKLFVTGI